MSRDQMFLTAKFSLLRQKARLLDQTMQCDQMFLTQQMRDLLCNMTVAADRYGTDAISLAHVLYFHGDKLSREAFGRNVRELGEAINLLAKEYKALQELLSAPHIAQVCSCEPSDEPHDDCAHSWPQYGGGRCYCDWRRSWRY